MISCYKSINKRSTIKEEIARSDLGLGSDEDQWTWEGIRDTVRLYYSTTQVTLPSIPVKDVMIKDIKKASKNTPVSDVAKIMIKNDVSHIPKVRDIIRNGIWKDHPVFGMLLGICSALAVLILTGAASESEEKKSAAAAARVETILVVTVFMMNSLSISVLRIALVP